MPITVESTRFGIIEVPEEGVIEFPEGIAGLPGHRWTLLARDAESDFLWLHSLEDPSVALPVTNPWVFFPEYAVEIDDVQAAEIGIVDPSEAEVYVTVRAAEALEDFRANLRAPILVHRGRGRQVINLVEAPIQAPMFAELAMEAA